MAITISGENNNDKILASDGVIDSLSGFNVVGIITATSFTGDLTGDVTGNLTGNVTGNINNSTLLLQTGGSERIRITGNNEIGIAGANYGSAGQVLTSGGSGSAVSWTTIAAQANISNNADNRVITGGSGVNLTGEANLTFTGQTLTAHMSTADPAVFVGDSNRTSAGQHVAEYRGYWDGNQIGRIVFAAGDDTTNKDDGIIKFHTTPSGGGITERLRIGSDGNITFTGPSNSFATIQYASNFTKLDLRGNGIANSYHYILSYGAGHGSADDFHMVNKTTNGGLVFRTGSLAAERLRIDQNGRVLIGHTASINVDVHQAALQVNGDNYSESTISIISNSSNSNGPYLFFAKQRSGSAGGTTIVQDGDTLGQIRFLGMDGTDYHNPGASIECNVDGTPGSNDIPGLLRFFTGDGGSLTERLRIKSDGSTFLQTSNVNINRGTNGAGYPLTVRGPSSGDVIRLERANSGQWHFGFDGNTNFTVKSNTTEVVRIKTDGKVGIGDDSPDALLSIKGNSDGDGNPSIRLKDGTDTREAWISNVSGDLYLVNGGNDNAYHSRIRLMDAKSIYFDIDGVSGSALIIDSNGNLKQGQATPTVFTSTAPSNTQRFLTPKCMQGCVTDTTTLDGSGNGTFDLGRLWITDDTCIEMFMQVVRNDSSNYTTHFAKAFIQKVRGSGMADPHILYQDGAASGFSISNITSGGYTGGSAVHGTQVSVTGGAGGVIYRLTCFYTAISKNDMY